VGFCVTLTTRVAAASSAKIFTPRLCNSSWNAADTLANSALRSEERFRNSNLTEDPWMEAQAFLASRRADSSKVSALAGRGKKTKAKKSTNGSSWQRIARPRERGEHKFCLADTGLLDDDITAANRARSAADLVCCIRLKICCRVRPKFTENTRSPAKQFSAAHVHLRSRIHCEISVLKDDNNESDRSSS